MRSGDKGRGKEGEPLGNFEPGTDVTAQATVLAEGCWGSLTGAAIREFDLGDDREPQVWELGVKEVWKVKKPLDRVIHTIGAGRSRSPRSTTRSAASWIYPMKDEKTGDDLVSIGFVVDLDYADATTSAHDLLQLFKTHPLVKKILEGGERVAWGAKAIPAGGYWAMPKLSMPGAVIVGDAGGLVNLAALKGVHFAIKSGMLAGRDDLRVAQARPADASSPTRTPSRSSFIGKDLYEVRNIRQPFSKGLIKGGPLVNLMIATKGTLPRRALGAAPQRRPADVRRQERRTRTPSPTASTRSTSSRASSSPATQTRDDAPNHIRVQKNVPREIAETWRLDVPGRRLRDPR